MLSAQCSGCSNIRPATTLPQASIIAGSWMALTGKRRPSCPGLDGTRQVGLGGTSEWVKRATSYMVMLLAAADNVHDHKAAPS